MSVTPTPIRIGYIHPVDLLFHRLQEALLAVSALQDGWECSDGDHRAYGKKYLDPALHAIRHKAGTRIRRQFGLEAAQLLLGHVACDVTQVYAEANSAKALDVARRIGQLHGNGPSV